jgi:hypothetical protein
MESVINASKDGAIFELAGLKRAAGARVRLLTVVGFAGATIVSSYLSLAIAGDELSIRPEVFGSLVQEDGKSPAPITCNSQRK